MSKSSQNGKIWDRRRSEGLWIFSLITVKKGYVQQEPQTLSWGMDQLPLASQDFYHLKTTVCQPAFSQLSWLFSSLKKTKWKHTPQHLAVIEISCWHSEKCFLLVFSRKCRKWDSSLIVEGNYEALKFKQNICFLLFADVNHSSP